VEQRLCLAGAVQVERLEGIESGFAEAVHVREEVAGHVDLERDVERRLEVTLPV